MLSVTTDIMSALITWLLLIEGYWSERFFKTGRAVSQGSDWSEKMRTDRLDLTLQAQGGGHDDSGAPSKLRAESGLSDSNLNRASVSRGGVSPALLLVADFCVENPRTPQHPRTSCHGFAASDLRSRGNFAENLLWKQLSDQTLLVRQQNGIIAEPHRVTRTHRLRMCFK